MNFFYIKNDKIICGAAINDDISIIENIVPYGLKIYIYTTADEVEELIANDKYSGIGKKKN